VAIPVGRTPAPSGRQVPILRQSLIETGFPDIEPCTERVRLSALRRDDGSRYFMERGIVTGALAEHEIVSYSETGTLTIGLSEVADQIVARRRITGLSDTELADVRSFAVACTRDWQQRFTDTEDGLPWSELVSVLVPQTPLLIVRPDQFAIRVQPDAVVGVGSTLVAVEFSTARDPDSISPARVALNWHALVRERLRRARVGEWTEYDSVATRIEMLALGYGLTIRLTAEEAEGWRVKIGQVAEAILAKHYEPNRGPWCSRCWSQAECWGTYLAEETDQGTRF
jgi:hypothetical protein